MFEIRTLNTRYGTMGAEWKKGLNNATYETREDAEKALEEYKEIARKNRSLLLFRIFEIEK